MTVAQGGGAFGLGVWWEGGGEGEEGGSGQQGIVELVVGMILYPEDSSYIVMIMLT